MGVRRYVRVRIRYREAGWSLPLSILLMVPREEEEEDEEKKEEEEATLM